MTRDAILHAQRILTTLDNMQKIKDEISLKFHSLSKFSSKEQIREAFEFIVKNDASHLLYSAISGIEDEIDKSVKELEEELKAL